MKLQPAWEPVLTATVTALATSCEGLEAMRDTWDINVTPNFFGKMLFLLKYG